MRQAPDYRPSPRLDGMAALQGTQLGLLLEQRTEEDKKQAGIDRAADGEGKAWRDYAFAQLEALASRQGLLFVDDLYAACDWLPANPNSWGSVWQRALREKLIVEANVPRRKSQLPGKHAHRYPVYESRYYDRGSAA